MDAINRYLILKIPGITPDRIAELSAAFAKEPVCEFPAHSRDKPYSWHAELVKCELLPSAGTYTATVKIWMVARRDDGLSEMFPKETNREVIASIFDTLGLFPTSAKI